MTLGGFEQAYQDEAAADVRRRTLPLCTPEELAEELADIDRELERLDEVKPVSADAAERLAELRASKLEWRARVAEQLDEEPKL